MSRPVTGSVTLGGLTGEVLERYQVLQEIGRGGYGVVYKAKQLTTGQFVAIKKLRIRVGDQDADSAAARFSREMGLIARLRDPAIVRLYDSGLDNGYPYMVLEYVEGRELRKLLKDDGPLQPAAVKRLMIQVVKALAEAHEHGIVHRDLKPANLMVSGTGHRLTVKVLDFGIAGIQQEKRNDDAEEGITVAGEVRGTPAYMAPEQLRLFGEARPESDIYALGLVMLECLTGERAMGGSSLEDIMIKQLNDDVEIPDAIAATPFGPIICTACQKDPEARFQSADELLSVLEAVDLDANRLLATLRPETLQRINAVMTGRAHALRVPAAASGASASASTISLRKLMVLVLSLAIAVLAVALVLALVLRPAAAPQTAAPEVPSFSAATLERLAQRQLGAAASSAARGLPVRVEPSDKARLADAMMRARLARDQGDYQTAIRSYKEALELEPEHFEALKEIGWTLVDDDQFGESIDWLVRAFDADPAAAEEDKALHLLLASAYEGENHLADAKTVYSLYLKRFPSSDEAGLARMQLNQLERDEKKAKKQRKDKKGQVKRPKQFK